MKKIFKRLALIIICAAMVISSASVGAFAAEERKTVDSGICGINGGDNLKWTLYDDGELVVSGKGEMDWYFVKKNTAYENVIKLPPWYDYKDEIKVITIEEGVESIGYDAFSFDGGVFNRVNLPASLKYYEAEAGLMYYDTPFYDIAEKSWAPEEKGLVYRGMMRAFCYPLSENDFNKVERHGYEITLNKEWTEITRTLKETDTHNDLNRFPIDTVCYLGEEPPYVCELWDLKYDMASIEKGDTVEIYARHYSGALEDYKIVWKTDGDAFDIEYYTNPETGVVTAAKITSARYGYYTITAELVDGNGNVLATDSIKYYSDIPEDRTFGEKTKEFFQGLTAEFAWFVYMIKLLGYLIGMSIFG